METSPPAPVPDDSIAVTIHVDNGLPTPPEDNKLIYMGPPPGDLSDRLDGQNGRWAMRSGASVSSLTASDDPPDFEEAQSDPLYMGHTAVEDPTNGHFGGLLGPVSNRNSPTSDADVDFVGPSQMNWNDSVYSDLRSTMRRVSPSGSDNWADSESNLASPSYSNASSDNTNETGQRTFATATEGFDDGRGRSP